MLFDLFSVDSRGRFYRFISEKMKQKLMNNVKNKKTIHLKSSIKSKIRIESSTITAAEADKAGLRLCVVLC